MGVRLFAPAQTTTLSLSVTTAINQALALSSGTAVRIANPGSVECVILLTNASTNTVTVPVSTSVSTAGMSIPAGAVVGCDLGGATWISGLQTGAAAPTAAIPLRITQGEGGLT